MGFDPSETIGVVSVSAAGTYLALKIIDRLTKRLPNGHAPQPPAPPVYPNGSCKAPAVSDRLREYHEENRDLLMAIRDGIKELIVLEKFNPRPPLGPPRD